MKSPTADFLLETYFMTVWDEERTQAAHALLNRARAGDAMAQRTLPSILNSERDSTLRMEIVECLHATGAPSAVPSLAKVLFDADPLVRARAAVALEEIASARQLSHVLLALIDAVPDPATRTPAEKMIRAVTGRAAEKITVSERERLRAGDHAETLWAEHFATLPLL